MAKFAKGQRVKVDKGVDLGKLGTVQTVTPAPQPAATYTVLVDGEKTPRGYAESSIEAYSAPPAPTPSGSVVFEGDLSTGDFSQWDAVQDTPTYAKTMTEAQAEAALGITVAKVIASTRPGVKYAGQFTVTKSKTAASRAELGTGVVLQPAQTRWTGFSFMVPSVPNKADGWGVTDFEHHTISQLSKPVGDPPPPVALQLLRLNGVVGIWLADNSTAQNTLLEQLVYDKWYDFASRVLGSRTATGEVEAWLGGTQRFVHKGIVTLDSEEDSYEKTGLYTTGTSTLMVEIAAFRIATTRELVDPSVRFAAA